MIFKRASISIKGHNIVMLIKIQKIEKDELQSIFFQFEQQTLWLFLFNHCNHNKFQQTLLFCFLFSESFTKLFKCSLWVRYPSLVTNYYF